MTVTVKFFASLRETMGRGEVEVDAALANTVADAWRLATGGKPVPANVLVAVNLEYTQLGASIRAGDEVAFFPPVTGGRGAHQDSSAARTSRYTSPRRAVVSGRSWVSVT